MAIGGTIRSLLSLPASCMPSSWLLSSSDKILLPTYHTVSDTPLPHIQHLYKVKSVKKFTDDLEYLLKHYEPIDLSTLLKLNRSERDLHKKYFHLTFDDGFRECFEIIIPILQRKGIPATFFLNPSFIDNKELMHRNKASLLIHELMADASKKKMMRNFLRSSYNVSEDPVTFLLSLNYTRKSILNELALLVKTDFDGFLANQKPYLTTPEIQQMLRQGFTIGAHSIDHPEFYMLTPEEQLQQTIGSMDLIQEKFKLAYRVFAFPFTDSGITQQYFYQLNASPHSRADLTFGVAGLKEDIPTNLQRVPMENGAGAKKIIKTEYLYYLLKKPIGKNRIIRK